MSHVLVGTYFVLLLVGAIAVIVGMLSANRDDVLAALGLDDAQEDLRSFPLLVERRRSSPRVIRMGSSASISRLAA